MTERPLFLDACCAINLLASGAAEEILTALPHPVFVARVVLEEEVLHIRSERQEGDETVESDESDLETHTLQPWVDQGLAEVAEPDTKAEVETFVDLALQLDDGEAMTGALAVHRNGLLATDDKKAIRVVRERLSRGRIRRTSQLVKHWAGVGQSDERVREVLRNIERVGSFRPSSNDPELEWWRKLAPPQ